MKFARKRVAGLVLSGLASFGLLSYGNGVQAGPDARSIMDKVGLTRKLDGSEAVAKMTIITPDGQTRERKLSVATKLYDNGQTEKRVYRFLSPADVKGTGILVFDYDKAGDDIWVFLPALRKTRRILSAQRNKSFMGSEFSYGDLNIPTLDDYNYTYVKEESYGGEPCHVIDLSPKNDDVKQTDGYSKKTYWVSKATSSIRKGLYYDLSGTLLKEFKCDNVKLLDDAKKRYRPMRMEMINKQNGRRSVFVSEQMTNAPNTKDEYFTTRYLERP